MRKINRRKFIKTAITAAGATLVSCNSEKPVIPDTGLKSTSPTRVVYLPFVNRIGASTPSPSPTLTPTPTSTPTFSGGIVADHTVVDKYSLIPQSYIDQIKKMWVDVPGESHSLGYRKGCQLLQNLDPKFQVKVTEPPDPPEPYTDLHMRICVATWGDVNHSSSWVYNYGEEDWFTNAAAIQHTKDHLSYCNMNNLTIGAMGFAWCWDMIDTFAPGGGMDPVYKVRWEGSTILGPDGNKPWGLDANDNSLTLNHVCMDTYLNATQQYINHSVANNIPTKVFFTTGPVDREDINTGQIGFQRAIKHDYIRNYVQSDSRRILFDYADILCWNNAGQQKLITWSDGGGTQHSFQFIHPDNMLDLNGSYVEDGDHIGQQGALRLGKALWWMMARIAGWSG